MKPLGAVAASSQARFLREWPTFVDVAAQSNATLVSYSCRKCGEAFWAGFSLERTWPEQFETVNLVHWDCWRE